MKYSKWQDLNVTAKFNKETVRVLGTNQKYMGMYWIVECSDGETYDKVKPSELTEWNWDNAETENKEPEKRRRVRSRKNR